MKKPALVLLGMMLFISGHSRYGYAEGGGASKSALDDHFHWGNCRMSRDPNSANWLDWFMLCLKGKASSQWSRSTKEELDSWRMDYAKGYAGLHLSRYLSFHGQGVSYKLWGLKDKNMLAQNRETDRLFMQIGNVGLDKIRLSAGKMDSPFGLNDRPLMDFNYYTYKNDAFWETPPYAAKLSIDNKTDIQFDLGFATGKDSIKEKAILINERNAYTGRLMIDIPALEGTRFVISGYRDNKKQKRYGAALLNNSKGATTSFEWVRIPPVDEFDPIPFQQLLRFLYYGQRIENKPRFLFEYEDELKVHWMTTLGYDIPITSYGLVRLGTSYFKARKEGDLNHWRWSGGLQVNL